MHLQAIVTASLAVSIGYVIIHLKNFQKTVDGNEYEVRYNREKDFE